eukprot:SAG31_NODE_2432_length_5706_cov_41.121634_3_plen_99_part_00
MLRPAPTAAGRAPRRARATTTIECGYPELLIIHVRLVRYSSSSHDTVHHLNLNFKFSICDVIRTTKFINSTAATGTGTTILNLVYMYLHVPEGTFVRY